MQLPKIIEDFEVTDSHTVKFKIDVTDQNPQEIPVYAFIADPDLKPILDLDLASKMPKMFLHIVFRTLSH